MGTRMSAMIGDSRFVMISVMKTMTMANASERVSSQRRRAGASGSTMCDGYAALWWIVLSAVTTRRFLPSGSPVFGLASKRGKLLLEMSTRMRCPFLNTFAVGKGSIVNGYTVPGVSITAWSRVAR